MVIDKGWDLELFGWGTLVEGSGTSFGPNKIVLTDISEGTATEGDHGGRNRASNQSEVPGKSSRWLESSSTDSLVRNNGTKGGRDGNSSLGVPGGRILDITKEEDKGGGS